LSTIQKAVIGGLVTAVVLGGAAWAAVDATSSNSPSRGPSAATARAGTVRQRPLDRLALGGARFGCSLAHADGVVVRDGRPRAVRFDHGTLTSVGSNSVTITEADGSSVTVPVDTATRIRKDRQRATLSDLESGDVVFAVRIGRGAAKLVRASDQDPCGTSPQPATSPSA
jgi:hypothetical protein